MVLGCFMVPKKKLHIDPFNLIRQSIKIDRVEYMDLDPFKGSRFYSCGKFDTTLHQKQENKVLYW